MLNPLTFEVAGERIDVAVSACFNAGYTGRDQASVAAHIEELAEQGIAAPGEIPTLFSIPAYMTMQIDRVEVEHSRTSGEAEWALVYLGEDESPLLTVASDHTDRSLEAFSVVSSKQSTPNIVGAAAWRLDDIADELDEITLRSWVLNGEERSVLQDGTVGDLISPIAWIDRLAESGRLAPGVVLLGGTIPMADPDRQFADGWEVVLERSNGEAIGLAYRVSAMNPSVS